MTRRSRGDRYCSGGGGEGLVCRLLDNPEIECNMFICASNGDDAGNVIRLFMLRTSSNGAWIV